MIKGFPKEIKVDNYMDATKVNSSLRYNNVQQGAGTSLLR